MNDVKLRKVIGILASATPILLILGGWTGGIIWMGDSLSSYNWANDRVLFLGLLSICGSFLISYEGYDLGDKRITTLAGISMIGVALFPCTGGDSYLFLFIPPNITNIIHGICATITFSSLGYMSYFQFPKTYAIAGMGLDVTDEKIVRNKIYRICGIIIFASLGLIALTGIFGLREATDTFRLFYILESIILEAFAFSFMVKGGMFFADKEIK